MEIVPVKMIMNKFAIRKSIIHTFYILEYLKDSSTSKDIKAHLVIRKYVKLT